MKKKLGGRRKCKRSEKSGTDKKVDIFRKWCNSIAGITLNPKVWRDDASIHNYLLSITHCSYTLDVWDHVLV